MSRLNESFPWRECASPSRGGCRPSSLPTVLPHVEGPHSGPLLRAPHLQNAPPRGVDHKELSYSAGTLSISKGGRIHLFGDSLVEVLYNLDPADLGVPIPLETEGMSIS